MKMRCLLWATCLVVTTTQAPAQVPELTAWIVNRSGETGYDGIPSNVQRIRFSDDNVYVSCSCIPGYDIGPWPGNPNTPVDQRFVFRIPRRPTTAAGIQVTTPLGHIGIWTNGVSIFNARDARSYNNAGIWNQNAVQVEGPGFDNCLGHPAPSGEYHHHLNPRCLYDDTDSSRHSPILGFAFDGYPVYGAYGYRHPDGSGGVTRMRSSYRRRAINERATLPDGTVLPSFQVGPPVSSRYPRGYYCEDFEYVPGGGDLDEHNGRICTTPEYPRGTYAYFVTLDEAGEAAYPYTLGPTYYGDVRHENIGPGSGRIVPDEPVEEWGPSRIAPTGTASALEVYPNPATDHFTIRTPSFGGPWNIELIDVDGAVRFVGGLLEAGARGTFSSQALVPGLYIARVSWESTSLLRTCLVMR